MPSDLHKLPPPEGMVSMLASVLLAPAAWLAGFQINYMIVPFTCLWKWYWAPHVVSLVSFAIAAWGLLIARGTWRSGGQQVPGTSWGPVERTRLIGVVGMSLSGLMMYAIFNQWLTILVVSPCIDP